MEVASSGTERAVEREHTLGQQGDAERPGDNTLGMEVARSLNETPHTDHDEYSDITGGRGWTQHVLEETKDMVLLLSSVGRVLYASPSCQSITGYTEKQLEGKPLSQLIHEDDRAIVTREMDECIAAGRPMRCFHFRLGKLNDGPCVLEAQGHPHIASHNVNIEDGNTGRRCDGFFLVCRPYPTKSSRLLDSFLEHKIENIRLNYQIAKLKEEEEDELNASRLSSFKLDSGPPVPQPQSQPQHQGISSMQPNATEQNNSADDEYDSDSGLNVEDPEQETDNPTESDDRGYIDGIELMTGLYYGEGERSQGLSTGVRRGRLVQCDIDVTTTDQQARTIQDGERRKRLKGEYSCTDCGTSDSPEWRKGPEGPKTLCNACGLRWSKKEKKRQDV